MRERAEVEAKRVAKRFKAMTGSMTERARRLFAATEAFTFGHGGIRMVSTATGMAPKMCMTGTCRW